MCARGLTLRLEKERKGTIIPSMTIYRSVLLFKNFILIQAGNPHVTKKKIAREKDRKFNFTCYSLVRMSKAEAEGECALVTS